MQDGRSPDFQTFLYAYSLGCLDKDDFIHLLEHIESGENFPWQELGEFQNLAALLPSFLNIEDPSPSVKDKVARKLYRIREDKKVESTVEKGQEKQPTIARTKTAYHEKMKTKITEKPAKTPPVSERISIPDEEISVPQDFRSSDQSRPSDPSRPQQDTQVKHRGMQEMPDRERFVEDRMENPPPRTGGFSEEKQVELPDDEFVVNQPGYAPEPEIQDESPVHIHIEDEQKILEPSQPAPDLEAIRRQVVEKVQQDDDVVPQSAPAVVKAGVPPWLFYIMVLVMLGGIFGVYYMMNQKTAKSQQEITDLRKQVQSAVQVSNTNTEVLQFTVLKESGMIVLRGSAKSPDAYGHYIFNTASKQGYLMLANLPPTLPEYGYQLWYEVNGTKTPIGIPNEYGAGDLKIEYTKLANIPVIQKNQKPVYYITQEKRGQTAVNPSKERFLISEE